MIEKFEASSHGVLCRFDLGTLEFTADLGDGWTHIGSGELQVASASASHGVASAISAYRAASVTEKYEAFKNEFSMRPDEWFDAVITGGAMAVMRRLVPRNRLLPTRRAGLYFLSALGVPYRLERQGYGWDGTAAYVGATGNGLSGVEIMHEGCHWLMATEAERRLPEFGLGSGFSTHHSCTVAADEAAVIDAEVAEIMEGRACLLDAMVAASLGYDSSDELGITNTADVDFDAKTITLLACGGLLTDADLRSYSFCYDAFRSIPFIRDDLTVDRRAMSASVRRNQQVAPLRVYVPEAGNECSGPYLPHPEEARSFSQEDAF